MTDLKKKVSRRAELLTDHRMTARPSDQVVVTLYPNKTIGFRGKRRRKEYVLPLETVYLMAVKADMEANRKPRRAKKG